VGTHEGTIEVQCKWIVPYGVVVKADMLGLWHEIIVHGHYWTDKSHFIGGKSRMWNDMLKNYKHPRGFVVVKYCVDSYSKLKK
jgi:hypothetical protein